MSSRSPLNSNSSCAIGAGQMELEHGCHSIGSTASVAIRQNVTKPLLFAPDESLARSRVRRDWSCKEGQCAGKGLPARGEMEMDNLPTKSRDEKTTTLSFSRVGAILFIGLLLALWSRPVDAATKIVTVGDGGFFFFPSLVTINVGDTVEWTWSGSGHSSTSGTPSQPSGFWDSGILNNGATFSHTFPAAGSFPYFCSPHGACCGMIGSVTVSSPTPTPDSNSFAHPDTESDCSRPVAERLYQVGCGNW